MHDTHPHTTIAPVRPPAPYCGGKRLLAGRLNTLIETIPHETYAEPFLGMGGVFFRRRRKPASELINDLSRDVTTLFRVLQRHHGPFMDMLAYQLSSRDEFERLAATDPATLTDLERAARFLYLQRLSFSGRVVSRALGARPEKSAYFDVSTLPALLRSIHARLTGVVIECLPYGEFIERYDRPSTLFYIDPPYWGCENYYGTALFSRQDFSRLRDLLADLEGRFILSLNDTPQVRALFARFFITEVPMTYSMSPGRKKKTHELLISNVAFP